VGDVSGFAVDTEELLVLPEPLESSPGEFAGPGRLVLSTLAMIMYGVGNTPTNVCNNTIAFTKLADEPIDGSEGAPGLEVPDSKLLVLPGTNSL